MRGMIDEAITRGEEEEVVSKGSKGERRYKKFRQKVVKDC